jgi:hypothetical protein
MPGTAHARVSAVLEVPGYFISAGDMKAVIEHLCGRITCVPGFYVTVARTDRSIGQASDTSN